MVIEKNGDLIIKAENLIDEAVRKGYRQGFQEGGKDAAEREEKAYQRGLDDAWKAAKKSVYWWADNEGGVKVFKELFNSWAVDNLFKFSASEAIAKIRKYEQEHAPHCDNCRHKDDETETTEAKCGECHRRYFCEASPDSCIHAKIAQAEPEKEDDEIKVGDEVIYQRKSDDPHNGEKGVVIGIGGNWREVRFLSNWSSVGVHENSLIKTGRHFSQIEEVLKQMQEVEE